jgi:hypothetical protein
MSRRKSASLALVSAPWHLKHVFDMKGRTSRLNEIVSGISTAPSAGIERVASAKVAIPIDLWKRMRAIEWSNGALGSIETDSSR